MMKNSDVKKIFDAYPNDIKKEMLDIREAIFELAKEDDIGEIEETLKWGEPSYLTKKGSTVRMDWKAKHPDQYAVYFNCKTTLVETFKEIYGDLFDYEDNRAIVMHMPNPVPMMELKHCISLALRYHSIKHLPLLGA